MHATITLLGWRQCGRAFYKPLPDGYLHATVLYGHVVRAYGDTDERHGWAEPLDMTPERLRVLYDQIMRYEQEGLTQS